MFLLCINVSAQLHRKNTSTNQYKVNTNTHTVNTILEPAQTWNVIRTFNLIVFDVPSITVADVTAGFDRSLWNSLLK